MQVNRTVGAIAASAAGAVVGLLLGAVVADGTHWVHTPWQLVLGSVAAGLAVGLTTRPPFGPAAETVLIPAAPAVLLVALVATPAASRSLIPGMLCLLLAAALTCATTVTTYVLRQRRSRHHAAYTSATAVPTRHRGAAHYDR